MPRVYGNAEGSAAESFIYMLNAGSEAEKTKSMGWLYPFMGTYYHKKFKLMFSFQAHCLIFAGISLRIQRLNPITKG